MDNPYRYNAPAHWNDISTAPRDGSIIEIQNNWGVAPSFSLSQWKEGRGWRDVNDPSTGHIDGPHLSWRPYSGNASEYRDPTGGVQNTANYWRRACGMPPVPSGNEPFA